MAKKSSKFLLWQKIAAGSIAVFVVALFGYLYTLVLTEAATDGFVEGEHYRLVAEPRRVRGDGVEIMEFFSYACVHCFNFDDDLKDWAEQNTDRIRFVQTPALGSAAWRVLGRTYYTMEELGILEDNHKDLFEAIHVARVNFDSLDAIANWMDGRGTTKAAFLSMYSSPAVDQKAAVAESMARRMQVASVPSVIVNGKYLVTITREVGPSRMLEVMDYLVAKESGTTAQASPSD